MRQSVKRLSVLLLVAVLSVTMIGTLFASGQEEQAGGEDVLKIGYAPPTYDQSDFWGKLGAGVQEQLGERGVEFEFIARAPETHASHAQQYSIIQDMINLEVDYVLMGPTELYAQMGAYEALNDAGIPVIILNWTVPFEDEEVDILSWVGYSHAYGGELAGEWVTEWFKENRDGEGQIAAIFGNPGSLTEDRWKETAWAMISSELPDVELVYEGGAEYDRTKAYGVAQNILTGYEDVDFIFNTSSAMAVGTTEAVRGAGRDDIGIMGWGGTDEEIMAIWEGELNAAVFRGEYDVAVGAVDVILTHMAGDPVEEVVVTKMGIVDSRESILNLVEDYRLEALGLE